MEVSRAAAALPRPSEVHLWRIELDDATGDSEQLRSLLSTDELERALRFHFERDRRRYVTARAALRSVLGRCLGTAPEAVELRYGPQGRPSLAHADVQLDFNVSHTGGLGLIAVSRERVGVDVEAVRELDDLPTLIRSCCSSSESTALSSLQGRDRLEAFFAAWTRKEAIAKATGAGLGIEPTSIEVELDRRPEPRVLRLGGSVDAARGWTLRDLGLEEGFAGALAAPGPISSVSWREWRLTGRAA